MKHDTVISKQVNGPYTEVSVKSKISSVRYRYKTADKYDHPYLNEENLSYYIARSDEDEEDEYLLYHALQEDKKLCATFWTRNDEAVCEVFSDKNRYSVVIKDTWKEGYKTVFVARKGCLNDYFDLDEITDGYDRLGWTYINEGILDPMFEAEMITILSGSYIHPVLGLPYNVVIDFDGDDVLQDYGSEGLVISGLLLGYPLEATANLIKSLVFYFYEHPRRP